ncbi:hypothetical protein JXB27_01565 [Candidatus Woesearchaeota archaeon]|nr:hypothetical protein [Candidatus Woesearchaeota archaeon]
MTDVTHYVGLIKGIRAFAIINPENNFVLDKYSSPSLLGKRVGEAYKLMHLANLPIRTEVIEFCDNGNGTRRVKATPLPDGLFAQVGKEVKHQAPKTKDIRLVDRLA